MTLPGREHTSSLKSSNSSLPKTTISVASQIPHNAASSQGLGLFTITSLTSPKSWSEDQNPDIIQFDVFETILDIKMRNKILREDENLLEIVNRLVNLFHPEKIFLFGSKARGEDGEHSDYDLMVIIKKREKPRYKLAQEAEVALWGIWEATDIIVLGKEEFERKKMVYGTLPNIVLEEGVELYAA